MKEKEILPLVESKLGITNLNPMQLRMLESASGKGDIVLLSPTGSGKTLAFLLPMLKWLKPSTGRVQAVVIVPSRELALQIYEVARAIAEGYKVTPLYGGHKVEDEVNSLSETPDIIVATPGRLLDHIKRRNIDLMPCRICVLDEFDKSLELGFEEDMRKIFSHMKNLSRVILTSATDMTTLPEFVKLNSPRRYSYLSNNSDLKNRITVHKVKSDSNDKLDALFQLLNTISADSKLGKTIVFVNYRESATRVADFLRKKKVDVALYHGALDQTEREKAIAAFNNGSANVLVSTDLGSRGLDIDAVDNVIHYHLPVTEETYTHRNGRTARVDATGNVYLLISSQDKPEDYIQFDDTVAIDSLSIGNMRTGIATLYITAGKKEKLSKGDIVGFLTKECGIPAPEIGKIDVRDHYSLVALPTAKARELSGTSAKIKGEKRKMTLISI